MITVEDRLNVPERKPSKPPAQAKQATATMTAETPTADLPPLAAKGAVKVCGATKAAKLTKGRTKAKSVISAKQRDAASAAKQSRIVRSGTSTRMRGHVASRGKRTRARRDSKS